MRTATKLLLMVAPIMIALNAPASAEELDAGKSQYLSSCAACHGDDGRGKGPLSPRLRAAPPDLTTLARRNNGVFPMIAVYRAIDGRNGSSSHDNRDMPIWGCRHSPLPISRAGKQKSPQPDPYGSHLDLACDPEDVIANRILSVVEYLRRIQDN
jgi:hypothetical protein